MNVEDEMILDKEDMHLVLFSFLYVELLELFFVISQQPEYKI